MKEKARKLLQEIYKKYLSSGKNGVYFYGSILRADFDPQSSDIDGIAIVDDNVPLKTREAILKELAAGMPELKKFGFQFLYKSELNGGPTKGRIAQVISPKSLLLELPYWEHVAGENFHQTDFVPTSMDEALLDEARIIKSRGWDVVASIQTTHDYEYFVKKLIQVLYLLDEKTNGMRPFSYDTIRNLNTTLSKALLETKAAKYEPTVFQKNLPEFQQFIDQFLRN